MKSKMLSVVVVCLLTVLHSWGAGGVGDGVGSGSVEAIIEMSVPLGLVYHQSKTALLQAGFKAEPGNSVWDHNGNAIWTRPFTKMEGTGLHRIEVKVRLKATNPRQKFAVISVTTEDLGIAPQAE